MVHTLVIETVDLDEQALRRSLTALDDSGHWQLDRWERRWRLSLPSATQAERLCGRLLACAWVRQLDFAPSAGQR